MVTAPLNDLEKAVLVAFGEQEPSLVGCIERLRATGREFTGTGALTNFAPNTVPSSTPRGPTGFDGFIEVPGVPHGIGASITVGADGIEFLEIVAFANDWDGTFTSFVVRRA